MPPKPKKISECSETAAMIRALRESRGENQTRFAQSLSLSGPSLISKWESGESRPTPENFARLASISDGEMKKFFLAQAGVNLASGQEVEIKVLSALGGHLNAQHLAFAIEMAQAKAKDLRRSLTRTEFAELVIFIYDECHIRGRWDAATVEDAFASVRSKIHLTQPRASGDRTGKTYQEGRKHYERFGTGRS